MTSVQVNRIKTNPILNILLFILHLPYLIPFMGWFWLGVVVFNWQKLPWYVLLPVVFWSWICSHAVTETGNEIKKQINENGGVVTTTNVLQMILLTLLQYPTFLTAIWILFLS